MKIVQVIHGYPMRYNAGSEVYTQTLCHGLAARHDVHVFTREEDPFAPDDVTRDERDPDDARIHLRLVNAARGRDRYRNPGVDHAFATLLDEVQPDIVHIGHLNHLSTSLVLAASRREIPIVYTLHDYWVMCPRGQFMQTHPDDPNNLWPACDGQNDRKCAERCYARYFSGAAADEHEHEHERDLAHWTDWVARRMQHMRAMVEHIDLFIAPARYLERRYRDEFGLPQSKLVYLDYGFDRTRLTGRDRRPGEPFTFGYIGTHIPAKGIHQLLDAFGRLHGNPRLRIWGRPHGQETAALHALAHRLPGDARTRVEWLPEYRNQEIVPDVFDHVDAIVVPSIWVENSPLVIHEAQQARVPVITADAGGMAEYVHHEINGLLFPHRDPAGLAAQMQRLVDDPALAAQLGACGYIHDPGGDIPDIDTHVAAIEALYHQLLRRRDSARVPAHVPAHIPAPPGPWRVTFDTNPDTCNLRCIMCEEHSEHSLLQIQRKQAGKPRRIMPIALLRRLFAEAAANGMREMIPSTMGEPLLYDHFEDILELCRAHAVKLNLTTNGTFPRLGARAWAERIVPVTSDVKISWNGATAATHEQIMPGTQWDRVLANAREFIAVRDAHAAAAGHRCRVTFQLTFLDSNVDELADIVRLAIDLGVDRVKGHHLWAHFDPIKHLSMRRNPEAVLRWNHAVAAARSVAASANIVLDNIFPLDPDAREDIAPGGPCPFLGQEAWVSATGRFDPCCAPDAQRRTLGEFGDLHNTSLMDVWHGDAYERLRTTYRDHTLCLRCNMRKPVAAP